MFSNYWLERQCGVLANVNLFSSVTAFSLLFFFLSRYQRSILLVFPKAYELSITLTMCSVSWLCAYSYLWIANSDHFILSQLLINAVIKISQYNCSLSFSSTGNIFSLFQYFLVKCLRLMAVVLSCKICSTFYNYKIYKVSLFFPCNVSCHEFHLILY